MDVQGWITLTNSSGTPFANANTLLVAGAVGQSGQQRYDRGYYPPPPPPSPGAIRNPGTESAGRERLGDFYLYPLPERTTIANAQTKQVSFLDVGGAPALPLEIPQSVDGHGRPAVSANSVLRFSRRGSGGCSTRSRGHRPRLSRDARGAPQFVGEIGSATPRWARARSRHGQSSTSRRPTSKSAADRHQPAWRPRALSLTTQARGRSGASSRRAVGRPRIVSESQKSERRSADETCVWSRSREYEAPSPALPALLGRARAVYHRFGLHGPLRRRPSRRRSCQPRSHAVALTSIASLSPRPGFRSAWLNAMRWSARRSASSCRRRKRLRFEGVAAGSSRQARSSRAFRAASSRKPRC